MATITINGNSLDPLSQATALHELGLNSEDVSDSSYILVQVTGPLTKDQKQQLKDLGVTILEYVPDDTYIASYPPENLAPIRQLPYVAWAGVYPKQVKVEPVLRPQQPGETPPRVVNALTTLAPDTDPLGHEPKTVEVVLHRNVDPNTVRGEIAEAVGLDQSAIKIEGQKARLTVSPGRIERLAQLDVVRHIEEFSGQKLYNNVALGLIRADLVQTNPHGFAGEGEVIAICDTGLDTGNVSTIHPAFSGRVVKLYPLARPTASDPHGHGTHVSGSAVGDGVLSDGARIRGTAPKAQLVVQSVLMANGGLTLPNNLNNLFDQPYTNDNARVHSNSWGDIRGDGSYSQQSREVDEFVWAHRDCVICFAAGNDGADRAATGKIAPGSVGAPSTAKNCICVGASESNRPSLALTYHGLNSARFPVNPIASDQIANNPAGVAAFSSRGPTRDHRIKPDVVAPGSTILSAKSRLATANPKWGSSSDTDYMFDAGTSMATPLVAGCAAVVRESFRVRHGAPPSAALVKAMLINGAIPLTGQYIPPELTPFPNESEGFGLVNLAQSVCPTDADDTIVFWDENRELDVGDEETHVFTIDSSVRGLKVTLVWTDPPGEALQNDLDLIVRDVNGVERHGNMPHDSTSFDRTNNVEQIVWENIAPGETVIIVRAFRIPVSIQSFALVARAYT